MKTVIEVEIHIVITTPKTAFTSANPDLSPLALALTLTMGPITAPSGFAAHRRQGREGAPRHQTTQATEPPPAGWEVEPKQQALIQNGYEES